MVYVVYRVRYHLDIDEHEDDIHPAHHGEIRIIRAWLLIEIYYFFLWILSSIIFLGFAYFVKFTPISKNEHVESEDKDIWNDKDRDDFLHYLKFEYFLFTFLLANTIIEIMLGFTTFDQIKHFGAETLDVEDLHLRAWYPTKLIFLLLIISNCNMLYGFVMQLHGDSDAVHSRDHVGLESS